MKEPPVARKLAVGHLCVRQLGFWLLVVSSFNYFQNPCMVYRHAVITAFRIYTQHSEDAAKGEVEGHVLKSHGNYIVDHGKSWKNHGIVFLNFCGNPDCWKSHVVAHIICLECLCKISRPRSIV